jgi:hypothetical protein
MFYNNFFNIGYMQYVDKILISNSKYTICFTLHPENPIFFSPLAFFAFDLSTFAG